VDFSHPCLLWSSLLIGMVGAGIFIYGKRQASLRHLGIGIALAGVVPFMPSLLVMWSLAGALLGLLFIPARDSPVA